MTTRAVRDNDLYEEIKKILGKWNPIPDMHGYGGTGAPGRMLENLLHIQENNQDLPDAGRWELKYTSNKSVVTLFHKDPEPRKPSVIKHLIQNCGWPGNVENERSFRHTIWGSSNRGFKVEVDDDKVTVRHDSLRVAPTWNIDDLNNSAVSKLRNLILVFGDTKKTKGGRAVKFRAAVRYSKFRFSEFKKGLARGWIAIDFDAKIKESGAVRNHGTKFRIKNKDTHLLYADANRIEG